MVRVWRRVVEPPTEWSVHLPNAGHVVVDPAKLHDYLLSPFHYSGRFKATFFESLGCVRDDEDSPRFVTAYPGVGE